MVFDATFDAILILGVDDDFINLYRKCFQMECKVVFWICSALSNPYAPCNHPAIPCDPASYETPLLASIETLCKKRLF